MAATPRSAGPNPSRRNHLHPSTSTSSSSTSTSTPTARASAARVRSSTTTAATVPLVAPVPRRASFIHRPRAVRAAAAASATTRVATPSAELAASLQSVSLYTTAPPPPPLVRPSAPAPAPSMAHTPSSAGLDQSATLHALMSASEHGSPAAASAHLAVVATCQPSGLPGPNVGPLVACPNPPSFRNAHPIYSYTPSQRLPTPTATPPPKDSAPRSPIPRSRTRNPLAAALAGVHPATPVPGQTLGLELGCSAPLTRLDVRA